MRKNFGAKAWAYPEPVFIIGTYDEKGTPDAMNAAWGGISDDTQICICLSPSHKTVANLKASGAFTVSMGDVQNAAACDYVGVESGNDCADKLKKAGWTATKSQFVNAPLIDQLPFALECKVISYDEKSCHLFGEIVNVSMDESILDQDGNLDLNKFKPIIYDSIHHGYYEIGKKVGQAFKDGLALK